MKLIKLLFLLLSCYSGHGQIQTIWETSYPMNTDSFEIIGTKLDEDENIYLYGHRHDTMFLQKKDSNGKVLWTLNHHDSVTVSSFPREAVKHSIIKDIVIAHEFIYAFGQIILNDGGSTNMFLIKLTVHGDTVWYRNHHDPDVRGRGRPYNGSDYKDHPAKIAFDVDGNLYGFYSGNSTTTPSRTDIITIKYSIDGELFWTKGANILRNTFLTLNFFRNVIKTDNSAFTVIGESRNASGKRGFLIVQLDTSANVIWNQFEGLAFSWNFAKGVVAYQDHIYVIVETKDTTINRMASTCIKYSKTGSRLWRKDINFNSTSEDTPVDIFIDTNSNLFCTALTTDSLSGHIFYLYKMDSIGNLLWIRNPKYNTLVSKNAFADAMGGGKYERTHPATANHFNSENDMLMLWIDSHKNPTQINKVLSCGKYLWDQVSDNSYIPLHIQKGKQAYYATFYSRNKLITTKFSDNTENKNINTLTAFATGANSIELNWQKPLNSIDSIKIERSTNGIDYQPLVSLVFNQTDFLDSMLIPNTQYHYIIYSKDAFGGYCPLAKDTATTWDNVGITIFDFHAIKFYPNPVSSVLNIHTEETGEVKYWITELSGKQILSGVTNGTINCQSLNPGIYFIETQTFNQKFPPQKFIKQ